MPSAARASTGILPWGSCRATSSASGAGVSLTEGSSTMMSAGCSRFGSLTNYRPGLRHPNDRSGAALLKSELGRMAVGRGGEIFGHEQQRRKDHGIDDRDRDDADGETAIVIVKRGPEHVAKSRDGEIEAAAHHQHRPLEATRT